MDQKRNFIVGIVSLILLISTSVLIIWKSDVRYRTSGYKLTGKFDNAGGLLKGAEIRYRGYRVGKVSKITPNPLDIEVEMWIKKGINIPLNSKARIQFDGLVGENYVGIQPDIHSDLAMKHNDIIIGSSGSDLANFIDIGSQNMMHAEAILASLRNLITSKDTNKAIRNILVSFDSVTSELSTLLKGINKANTSEDLAKTLKNFKELSDRLNTVTTVMFDQQKLDNSLHSIAKNLEEFSSKLNEMFPEKKSIKNKKDRYLIPTLTSIKTHTETSLKYTTIEKKANFQADVDLDFGDYFFRAGVGDRTGKAKFLHFQHGIYLAKNFQARIGLFYQEAGLGIDYLFIPKTILSVDVYKLDDLNVDIQTRIKMQKHANFLIGLRKNSLNNKMETMDLGLSYDF